MPPLNVRVVEWILGTAKESYSMGVKASSSASRSHSMSNCVLIMANLHIKSFGLIKYTVYLIMLDVTKLLILKLSQSHETNVIFLKLNHVTLAQRDFPKSNVTISC